MTSEELVTSEYEGFESECLTVRHAAPVTAPVLLLGGALHRKEAWGRLGSALRKQVTLVTVDLPGWGDAALLPASYDYDFLARSLADLLTAAGHDSVNIFGGSYGSIVAHRFAQLFPGRVRRIALFGTTTHVSDRVRHRLERTIELVRSENLDEFADYVLDILMTADESVTISGRADVSRILRRVFADVTPHEADQFEHNTRRLLEHDLVRADPPIEVPALVGAGEHDPFTDPAQARAVAETCTDAQFVLLRDADHPVHLEVPFALAELLLRFFTDGRLDDLTSCRLVERVTPVPERVGGTGEPVPSVRAES